MMRQRRRASAEAALTANWTTLPVALQTHVLAFLPASCVAHTLPKVARSWRTLAREPAAYTVVHTGFDSRWFCQKEEPDGSCECRGAVSAGAAPAFFRRFAHLSAARLGTTCEGAFRILSASRRLRALHLECAYAGITRPLLSILGSGLRELTLNNDAPTESAGLAQLLPLPLSALCPSLERLTLGLRLRSDVLVAQDLVHVHTLTLTGEPEADIPANQLVRALTSLTALTDLRVDTEVSNPLSDDTITAALLPRIVQLTLRHPNYFQPLTRAIRLRSLTIDDIWWTYPGFDPYCLLRARDLGSLECLHIYGIRLSAPDAVAAILEFTPHLKTLSLGEVTSLASLWRLTELPHLEELSLDLCTSEARRRRCDSEVDSILERLVLGARSALHTLRLTVDWWALLWPEAVCPTEAEIAAGQLPRFWGALRDGYRVPPRAAQQQTLTGRPLAVAPGLCVLTLRGVLDRCGPNAATLRVLRDRGLSVGLTCWRHLWAEHEGEDPKTRAARRSCGLQGCRGCQRC